MQQQGAADAHVVAMRVAQLAAERAGSVHVAPHRVWPPYPMGYRPLSRSTPSVVWQLSE